MSTKTNLILDLTMFGAFLAVSNPHLTGVTVHEWLGVSLAGAVITHLLFHWDWIIKIGKQDPRTTAGGGPPGLAWARWWPGCRRRWRPAYAGPGRARSPAGPVVERPPTRAKQF
ncbi:MAG TPA: hypothetical protein VK249_25785 [Anaerolineales bacterium]|nr:hypothetical protein [Anaerolineales bacterium]